MNYFVLNYPVMYYLKLLKLPPRILSLYTLSSITFFYSIFIIIFLHDLKNDLVFNYLDLNSFLLYWTCLA